LIDRCQAKFAISGKEIFNADRIIFGDFYEGIDVEQRVYKQIEDLGKMVEKIKEFLEDYNGMVKMQMNLVMFLDACDHVCRISRIIQRPLGNAFLLGVGGSGRQSLARLATFMSNYKIYQIEVVKGYVMMNWREDIKKVLTQAGVDNKETTFLFVDTQIINEQMLEDLNNVLNGGDVPGLYKKEDFEAIDKTGRQICIENGLAVNKMNMFGCYVKRIKRNMHMIIAMSPLGGAFVERCRKFPSMINCSTIDWFSEWPEEALLGVGRGQILLAEVDLGDDLDACVEMFKVIHQSVEKESIQFKELLNRSNHVTPTSFLEQLNMYKDIL
jgi:dynein heavy chain